MTYQTELTLRNRPEEVARFQDELERIASSHSMPSARLHQLQVAMEEHLTNILRYAYNDQAEHLIQVRIQLDHNNLEIEVADDGRAFNPLDQPAPDLTIPIEQKRIGGLGIYMLRKSVDQVAYRRDQGQNILKVSKSL